MAHLLRDVRFGLRLLRKNPGFTTVAVLTLALGVAATTAMFSVIYPTYLEPLPYRDAERLVMVWSRFEGNRINVSPADFLDWKREATAFDDLNAWGGQNVNMAAEGAPEFLQASTSTPGFLGMLGYGHPLAQGRTFVESESTPGNDQAVIISHRLWQQRFGGEPIVGQPARIDGKPYTVVGILGPGPADQHMNQLWLPLAFPPDALNRESRWLHVMGRLKPGLTVEQANADMAGVATRLAAAYPATNAGWTISVEPFRNNFVSDQTKQGLWLLMGAVGFLLLIACANVANLLLARGSVRQRELAVRASLGASRAAMLRQLVTESVVLSLLGGALGVVLAYGFTNLIVALMPPFTLPTEVDIRLNVPVLLFSLAASALSGILFGCAPAWQATRVDPGDTLKETGRSVSGGRHAVGRALVALEFALALTLLTGGGLALHSFYKLAHVDLGFRTERLLTFGVPVLRGRFENAETMNVFYRDVLARVQARPGVVSAAVSGSVPLRGGYGTAFRIAGQPPGDATRKPRAGMNAVSPDYHRTLGIRLASGRGFSARDDAGAPPVALVNETFVRRYLDGLDPLAQRIVLERTAPGPGGRTDVEVQIVGVTADVRAGGPRNEAFPVIEVPFEQGPWRSALVTVQTTGEPAALQQDLAAVIRGMDPDLPIANPKTMDVIVSERMAADRFYTLLLGAFAGLALLLASVGIYGVMSFVVSQRTHEIGLRMALGARRQDVLGLVVREGMLTALAGAILGTAGAWAVARAMQNLLYGGGELGSLAYATVALALLASALVACLVPARRAASVDPMVALRQD